MAWVAVGEVAQAGLVDLASELGQVQGRVVRLHVLVGDIAIGQQLEFQEGAY